MRKLPLILLLCAAALLLLELHVSLAATSSQTVVTAAQVNGTWRSQNGTFKIWALGNQRLRVEFAGTYEYNLPAGPMANTGEGHGIAFIEGDMTTFRPEGADDECAITMRFAGGRLIVRQEGECGFGMNVTAAGTYRSVSSRRPRFNDN